MHTKVDQTALKFNQFSIILLLIVAFLFELPALVAFVCIVMGIGTLWPRAGLFKAIYARILKPAGLLKPDMIVDEPEPHLFAQGVGAIVLVISALALWIGFTSLGWLLAGIVVLLAGVNLFLGFCAGCFIFYQLARRGIRLELSGWHSTSGNPS